MITLRLGARTRSLLTTALVCLCVVPATVVAANGSAHAATAGGLSFDPPAGLDSYSLSVVSTGLCTDPRGTNLQLRVSGAGFPDNTNVTPNLSKAVYPIDPRTGGYDVSLQDTMRAFASRQSPPAILTGHYVFTLVCRAPFGTTSFGSYSGSVLFASPTHYQSDGLASTVTPPASPVASTPHPKVTSPVAPPKTARATSAVPTSLKAASPTMKPTSVVATSTPRRSPGSTGLTNGATGLGKPHLSATTQQAAPSALVSPASSAVRQVSGPVPSSSSLPAAALASAAGQTHSNTHVVAILVAATLLVVATLGLMLRRRRVTQQRGPYV